MSDALAIAGASAAMSRTNLGLQVQTSVMKKSMDMQSQLMERLLAALPAAPVNPPHLGNHIDAKA